jgi:hypothetical protein
VLTRDQIVSVYRQVLERTPSEEEIGAQLSGAPDLDGLLRVALDSEEYAERLRQRGERPALRHTVVNVFHPDLAPWGLQPGTRSADDIAIVGREGWLFLCGGTNANLDQFVGAVETKSSWLVEWQEVLRRRAEESRSLGVASTTLVVPDKLAVYEEHYPEPLEKLGPRPVERLLAAADLGIAYPLEELRTAAGSGVETYIPTDTHLTFRGNELLFNAVAAALEVESPPDLSELQMRSYPVAGDLGGKFEPEVVSIVGEPGSLHEARIVEDNREEIAAVDGHIGTRRVFVNERAPDPRVAVVFGDSFGFGAAHYQGVSWFMAQAFREVHFIWVPFGWDPAYVERVGAEAVLVQGAERFVARVPRPRVDASRLAEETLKRKRPVGIEGVSD